MGRSKSSSQANQTTYNQFEDSKIANESGIVARDSVLDLSTSNNLSSWDASTSNYSSSNAYSSSNTSNTNTNTNTTSGSYNVTADPKIAAAAFDFATGTNATAGGLMSDILGLAERLNSKSTDSATTLASRFQDGVAQAYDSARNTTPGGIDNKTMIVLAVAGAAALAAIAAKRN